MHKTHRARTEAGKFLTALMQIQVGQATMHQVRPLVREWGGKWRAARTSSRSPCGGGASVVDFIFDNRWAHWFLFAPLTSFDADLYVKENSVCFRSVELVTMAGHSASAAYVSESRKSPLPVPFSVSLNPANSGVAMDAGATPQERTAAYAINLDCLTKLRGCRDTREMAPAMWEIAPTVRAVSGDSTGDRARSRDRAQRKAMTVR